MHAGYIVKLYARFYEYIRPYSRRNIINICLILGMISIGAVLIWMVGQGFDAFRRADFDIVPKYLIGFIALVVVLQSLRFASYYLVEWMQQRVINSVRREMYAHILELGTPFQDKSASGDLLARLAQDVVRVSEFLILMPIQLFTYGITLIIYIGLLFYIDSGLTVLALILVPMIFIHQRYFVAKTRKAAQSFLSYQGRMSAFEEESLRNIQGIATFSASASMLARFDRLFSSFRRSAMHNLILNNAFIVSFELLIAVAAILLVTVGVYRIDQDALTIGGLINFLLYLGYLSVPLRGLANVPIESQIRAVAAERVATIMDEELTVKDDKSAVELLSTRGDIVLRNVDFSYHDDTRLVKNLSLHIRSGEHLAIMGESGVGKTTLAKLILRIYDPDCGQILLDGVDIRDITLRSLRAHIAVVWQDPFFIDDSIYENLRLSKPDASKKQIRAALREAGADKFIERLPGKYETHLGHQGSQLSTGQKQRIAIAQALLKQASILVLDEATSSLDSDSELAIKLALQRLPRHCTVIIITHRMSTADVADRILYLNRNGSTTVGTLAELQMNHDIFRRTVSYQNVLNQIA